MVLEKGYLSHSVDNDKKYVTMHIEVRTCKRFLVIQSCTLLIIPIKCTYIKGQNKMNHILFCFQASWLYDLLSIQIHWQLCQHLAHVLTGSLFVQNLQAVKRLLKWYMSCEINANTNDILKDTYLIKSLCHQGLTVYHVTVNSLT